jgi:hypothetical protein
MYFIMNMTQIQNFYILHKITMTLNLQILVCFRVVQFGQAWSS